MDTSQLKRYAVQARRDFRVAVSARAKRMGVSDSGVQQYSVKGDLLIIGEQTFPKDYKSAFDKLYSEVAAKGFQHVIDETAYTWFNRFVAIRFMELHDYFPHGLRVLSSTDEDLTPQILRNPTQLSFTHSFNKKLAKELFEAGNKEEELYRMVLIAQCNELNSIMPFLFERVSDLSEILLPDNLLASDSIIRKLVSEIEESAWSTGVEIIGWIYQYYISEKKDEVIGKVVKSEDIPAATQLFTPNWIVKYLVQNSVGAYWLGTYPDSALVSKMEYYIRPAEQEPEVIAELKKITPTEIDPETITVLDPACGSGHILVEAYDVLKEIYLERGYRPREIPRLILEKNLFGLDIDGRAAQLACFALLMKARADDRSIFSADRPVKLNVLEIVETDFNIDQAVQALTKGKNVSIEQVEMPFMAKPTQGQLSLADPGTLSPADLREFLELFREAKTFGSLITVPDSIQGKVAGITAIAGKFNRSGDIFEQMYGRGVLRLCEQAKILGELFDVVLANPPYLSKGNMVSPLGNLAESNFSAGKENLCACFILRIEKLLKPARYAGLITLQTWMFTTRYKNLRTHIIHELHLKSLLQLDAGAFNDISGEVVQTCAFVFSTPSSKKYNASYFSLIDGSSEQKRLRFIEALEQSDFFRTSLVEFAHVQESPFSYWLSDELRQLLHNPSTLAEIGAEPRIGIQTGDNESFLRFWYEVDIRNCSFTPPGQLCVPHESSPRWFPLNKGGENVRWYSSFPYVIDWFDNGKNIKADKQNKLNKGLIEKKNSQCWNSEFYFRSGVTWTRMSSGSFQVRHLPDGYLFDTTAPTIFVETDKSFAIMGLLNSVVLYELARALNPTLSFQSGDLKRLPIILPDQLSEATRVVEELVAIAQRDSKKAETSWEYDFSPLDNRSVSISSSYSKYASEQCEQFEQLARLEETNNELYLKRYGLASRRTSTIDRSTIAFQHPQLETDIKRFLSYVIGCTLGRYSLDAPGLIYANSSNIGFDPTRYIKFPADSDGVVPILDYPWFTDDITTRFREFLIACWSEDTLVENMQFVADALEPKRGETPEETIRRYFCDDFFKNHLKMYKKRPIYWLFSSGKEKAFQALVYLHRYNDQTLSKMRTDYVLLLQGKMANEEKRLDSQAESSSSPAERNRYKKELEKLKKKQAELRKFDELLHHYADKRISLDLDDGVKLNYGKFGALLSEVKQVTGGKEDE
jgi:hypothetical protein